jgi:hypothetical protein
MQSNFKGTTMTWLFSLIRRFCSNFVPLSEEDKAIDSLNKGDFSKFVEYFLTQDLEFKDSDTNPNQVVSPSKRVAYEFSVFSCCIVDGQKLFDIPSVRQKMIRHPGIYAQIEEAILSNIPGNAWYRKKHSAISSNIQQNPMRERIMNDIRRTKRWALWDEADPELDGDPPVLENLSDADLLELYDAYVHQG